MDTGPYHPFVVLPQTVVTNLKGQNCIECCFIIYFTETEPVSVWQ